MIIDAHMHADLLGFDEKKLMAYLDQNGIDQCWLLTWDEASPSIPERHQQLPIERVMELHDKHPDRIVPMYAPDPNRPDAIEKLEYWCDRGVKGCAELKVEMGWENPKLDGLLDWLNAKGMSLTFHMEEGNTFYIPENDSSWDKRLSNWLRPTRFRGLSAKSLRAAGQVLPPLKRKINRLERTFSGFLMDFEQLEKRLQQYPNIRFVGHGPFYWKGISADVYSQPETYPQGPITGEGPIGRLMKQYDNMYADLSGMSGFYAINRDVTFTTEFLETHQNKIMFGTDNYDLGLMNFLETLSLSPETRRRIYGENAKKLIHPFESN